MQKIYFQKKRNIDVALRRHSGSIPVKFNRKRKLLYIVIVSAAVFPSNSTERKKESETTNFAHNDFTKKNMVGTTGLKKFPGN